MQGLTRMTADWTRPCPLSQVLLLMLTEVRALVAVQGDCVLGPRSTRLRVAMYSYWARQRHTPRFRQPSPQMLDAIFCSALEWRVSGRYGCLLQSQS